MYTSKSLITTAGELAPREKRLSICLRADGFSFAEVASSGALLSFGEAEGRHAPTMTTVMADVKAFFAAAGIRPLGYASMELIVLSDESVWVPDELYSSIANRTYLRLAGSTPDGVLTCHSRILASTAVFAANEQVVTAFKVAMPGVAVMHQHAKMALLAPRSQNHPLLLTHWRKGLVDVAAFRDGRYLFGNTLRFASEDEAVYHVVEVMRSYALEDPTTELLLCGDVDRERFAALRPYFPHANLFAGTVDCRQDPAFRTLPAYRYALLLI